MWPLCVRVVVTHFLGDRFDNDRTNVDRSGIPSGEVPAGERELSGISSSRVKDIHTNDLCVSSAHWANLKVDCFHSSFSLSVIFFCRHCHHRRLP